MLVTDYYIFVATLNDAVCMHARWMLTSST